MSEMMTQEEIEEMFFEMETELKNELRQAIDGFGEMLEHYEALFEKFAETLEEIGKGHEKMTISISKALRSLSEMTFKDSSPPKKRQGFVV